MNDGLNILILEDDIDYANVLVRLLVRKGHQAQWVCNGDDFNDELQKKKPIQLILMDLKLENGTSLALIKGARDFYPQAKILIVTGFASIATTVEAIKQGADDYLPKPITVDEILTAYFGGNSQVVAIQEKPLSPKRLEWEHIQRVLQANQGNISRTAKQLNMHRRTLQRKLQKKPTQQ